MTVRVLAAAETDLDEAFSYYEKRRPGLRDDLLYEFRRGIEKMLQFPGAWQRLDSTYRQYRLHRFPYGIVYRVDPTQEQIMVVAISHLEPPTGMVACAR